MSVSKSRKIHNFGLTAITQLITIRKDPPTHPKSRKQAVDKSGGLGST